jgi:hypothetical protein
VQPNKVKISIRNKINFLLFIFFTNLQKFYNFDKNIKL